MKRRNLVQRAVGDQQSVVRVLAVALAPERELHAIVLILNRISNPVPRSDDPVPNCNLANRWHYEQTLRNVGGTTLTISDRADFFDGVQVSTRSGLGIVLAPGQDTTITTKESTPTAPPARVWPNPSMLRSS